MIAAMLERLERGEASRDEVMDVICRHDICSIDDHTNLDIARESRTGTPEAILAEGKDPSHLLDIIVRCVREKGWALVTRYDPSTLGMDTINGRLEPVDDLVMTNDSGILHISRDGSGPPKVQGSVGVLSGGTADSAVAHEVQAVCRALGIEVTLIQDVGVATPHRVYAALEALDDPDILIVIAGREGTLPTVVSSLSSAPVIGVPVSTGYGEGGSGRAALYSMLQSCSPLLVVNIDAGFVAGVMAYKMLGRFNGRDRDAQVR